MSDTQRIEQKIDTYIANNDKYHEEQDERHKKYEEKIDEMHAILTATGLFGKAFRWILGTVIAMSAALIALKQLFHSSSTWYN